MFFRLVFGALFRQKSKMILIALTVALGISLSTAMLTVVLGVGDKINRELKTYGANIRVLPKEASLLDELYGIGEEETLRHQYLNEADVQKVKQIFWGFNVLEFAPTLKVWVQVAEFGGQTLPLEGTWFEKELKLSTGEELTAGIKKLKTWWQVEGQWLKDEDQEGILLGQTLAKRYGLKVGDQVTLQGKQALKLSIRGVLNAGGREDERAYVTLATAQRLSDLEGKVTEIEVSALTTPDNDLARKASQNPNSLTPSEYDTWYCTAYVSSICYQIQEVVQDAVAKPIRQVAESEGSILSKTQMLMLFIALLASIGSALGISNLVTASVIERSQELGLLKALGASTHRIVLRLLCEIFITGLVGAVLGYGAGIGFAQLIVWTVFSSSLHFAPMVIPINLALLVMVVLLGSLPAVRYLMKLKPTEVLHGR